MWYIDSGLITTQHTTYYCYVTYDLCALYNVDLDLQNMLNHPDGVKAPKEILLAAADMPSADVVVCSTTIKGTQPLDMS